MDTFIALCVADGKYYLATTRGLVWLGHPDAINDAKSAGFKVVRFDDASWKSLTTIMKPAP